MNRSERQRQLLETAAAIVRAEGTDSLTLAAVAERAGVSKPIAYEHFGTRAGLLIALYHHLDARRAEALSAAPASKAHTLEDAVGLLGAAYIDGVLEAGPALVAATAALSASEEMESVRQSLRDGYLERYGRALQRFVSLPKASRALLSGLIGSADGLAADAAAGRISRDEAVAVLGRIMLGALPPARRTPAKPDQTQLEMPF